MCVRAAPGRCGLGAALLLYAAGRPPSYPYRLHHADGKPPILGISSFPRRRKGSVATNSPVALDRASSVGVGRKNRRLSVGVGADRTSSVGVGADRTSSVGVRLCAASLVCECKTHNGRAAAVMRFLEYA